MERSLFAGFFKILFFIITILMAPVAFAGSTAPVTKVFSFDSSYNSILGSVKQGTSYLETLYTSTYPGYYPGEYPFGKVTNDYSKEYRHVLTTLDDKRTGPKELAQYFDILRNGESPGHSSLVPVTPLKPLIYLLPAGQDMYVYSCIPIPLISVGSRWQTTNYAYYSYTNYRWEWHGFSSGFKSYTDYLNVDINHYLGGFSLGTSYVCPLLKISRDGTSSILRTDVYPGWVGATVPQVTFSAGGVLSNFALTFVNLASTLVTTFADITLFAESMAINTNSIDGAASVNLGLYKLAKSKMIAPALSIATDQSPYRNAIYNNTWGTSNNVNFSGGAVQGFYPFYTPSNYSACNYNYHLPTLPVQNPNLLSKSNWQFFSQNSADDASGCRIRSYIVANFVDDNSGSVENFIRCGLKTSEAYINYVTPPSCAIETSQFLNFIKNKSGYNLASSIINQTSYYHINLGFFSFSIPYTIKTCAFTDATTQAYLTNISSSAKASSVTANEISKLCAQNIKK